MRLFELLSILPHQQYLASSFFGKERLGKGRLHVMLMTMLQDLSEKPAFAGGLLYGQTFDLVADCSSRSYSRLKYEALERLTDFVENETLPSKRLIKLAKTSTVRQIREIACLRVNRSLSEDECDMLASSEYSDVRLFAIQQGLVTKGRLIEISSEDPVFNVLKSAWQKLSPPFSIDECRKLLCSVDKTVRFSTLKLLDKDSARKELRSTLINLLDDPVPIVAEAAFAVISGALNTNNMFLIKKYNDVLWEKFALHPHISSRMRAEFIVKHVRKDKKVIDQERETEVFSPFPHDWEERETKPEISHMEYYPSQLSKVENILKTFPDRRGDILTHLKILNKELYDLVK